MLSWINGVAPGYEHIGESGCCYNDPPAKTLDAVSVSAPSLPVGAAIFKPSQDALLSSHQDHKVPFFVTSDKK
jgi:hypothetical protein